jgi:hypothetical protein
MSRLQPAIEAHRNARHGRPLFNPKAYIPGMFAIQLLPVDIMSPVRSKKKTFITPESEITRMAVLKSFKPMSFFFLFLIF